MLTPERLAEITKNADWGYYNHESSLVIRELIAFARASLDCQRELAEARKDTERIEWLEAHFGYALVNDDNGHWAISFDGMQSVGGGEEAEDLRTSFYIEAAKFKNTAREAIDAAITAERKDGQ